MALPMWAERAFEKHRPRAVGNAEPNPDRLEWWEGCKRRFELRWLDLAAESWNVPEWHGCYVRLHISLEWDRMDFVRHCILETALDLAWDNSVGKAPDRVAQAVSSLDQINADIATKARELSSLFRQRDLTQFDEGVTDCYDDCGELDPRKLWDVLELAMSLPHVGQWAHTAREEAAKFFSIAQTQSRPKPQWPDLLDMVAEHTPRPAVPCDAGDVAIFASRTNRTDQSQWGRRFLGTLDDWSGTFPRGFLRGCLTGAHLAALLEVALDAPPEAFNKRQMERLSATYAKAQK